MRKNTTLAVIAVVMGATVAFVASQVSTAPKVALTLAFVLGALLCASMVKGD